MKRLHSQILKVNDFIACGTVKDALASAKWDGLRVLYAISDPKRTRIVYVGESERGRNLRSRLKDHLNQRSKKGLVEKKSYVWVHFMVTECSVLCCFQEYAGALPELNGPISRKWARNAR